MGKTNNIAYIEGDVVDISCDIILHQVNCKGIMGSGVALAVRQKYPNVYEDYVKLTSKFTGQSNGLLGYTQYVGTPDNKIVANMFTQDGLGGGKRHTEYDHMKTALTKLNTDYPGKTVALPYKMGSDRGGGEWSKVLELIKENLTDMKVIIVQYNKW